MMSRFCLSLSWAGAAVVLAQIALFSCRASLPEAIQEDVAVDAETVALVDGDPIKFGVLAIDSAVSVSERYGPLMQYLSEALERPVELVTLSQESQFFQVEQGDLDFTTNNPLAAVQIQRLYGTEFLVTHARPDTGAEFSGLIIVDRDSDVTTLADLKGKRAACVAFQTAAAGCTFQIYHLLQNGIDPYVEFSSFVENRSQDNIVLAVLNGSIDVGFIRTGQLEKMLDKGLISSLDEVRIIDQQVDDFVYPHTTALYPEWPVAALPGTDPQLADQLQQALLEMPDDHGALKALRASEFVPAVDYSLLNELIEELQLRSWDAPIPTSSTEGISP